MFSTHLIGKWGLGFCAESMTPQNRGYDGFDGSYDHVDGFTLTRDGVVDLSVDTNGTFSSKVFGDKVVCYQKLSFCLPFGFLNLSSI